MNPAALGIVFIGGGVGSVCRFLLSGLAVRWLGTAFPYGTLAVNLLGAFLIGLIAEFLALKLAAPEPWRLLLVTGFLGGFTTFSAFSLENALMAQRGDYGAALLYALVSVFGTGILVLFAAWLVRQWI